MLSPYGCSSKGGGFLKFDRNNLDRPWIAYTIAICSGVVLYLTLSHFNIVLVGLGKIYGFIRPVFLGLCIAYILNPLAKIIRRYVLRRVRKESLAWALSVALTMIVVILGFIILLIALIPQVYGSARSLIGNMNYYMSTINSLLDRLNNTASGMNLDLTAITDISQDILGSILKWLTGLFTSKGGTSIFSTVTDIGLTIFNFIITIIISVYFLLDKARLQRGMGEFFSLVIPEERHAEAWGFWNRCNTILVRFIGYDLLDGLLVGVINYIFMRAMHMSYGVLISVVVGVCNRAPTFGPMFGAVIGAFILLLIDPWQALIFLIFPLILQTVDGYILKPRLFGGSLGVPPIWVLMVLIVFGRMFGVVGLLLAIPFAGIMDFIYHNYILTILKTARKKRQERKAMEAQKPVDFHVDKDGE